MVPMVGDAIEAERVVNAARFAPNGGRGFGLLYPDQLAEGVAAAMSSARRTRRLVILQIETSSGVDHVEDIAVTPGVDCSGIGQFDLTVSMGIPGAFEDQRLREAEDRVRRGVLGRGDRGGHAGRAIVEAARSMLQTRGFRMIALGSDIGLYGRALRTGLNAARSRG